MKILWVVVGLGVFGVAAVIARWHGRGQHADLGFVSNQWVAERRVSEQHQPSR